MYFIQVFILINGIAVLSRPWNQQSKNEEPCDWFIDLLQKRRLSRDLPSLCVMTQMPAILVDVTEEPKEVEKYPAAPFEISDVQLCGVTVVNNDCVDTNITTSTTTVTPAPAVPGNPIEPCQPGKTTNFDKSTPTTTPEPETTTPQPETTTPEPETTTETDYVEDTVEVKETLKPDFVRNIRDMQRCGECNNENNIEQTGQVLFEAKIHIGEELQGLLLDMLSPGDKTLKISEEDDGENLQKIKWEMIEDDEETPL